MNNQYDILKPGNLLFWVNPENGERGGYKIMAAPQVIDENTLVRISSEEGEREVPASQLIPIPSPYSHKADFIRWKAEREADGKQFFNHLSEVMDTDSDLSVGDMVAFTNDYGVVFGPQEVLAFGNPDGGRCVYTDSDAYWFASRPNQLTILQKGA